MKIATRTAFGAALENLGEKFPKLCTVDADLSGSTKTGKFAKKFPDRAFNVGIAEQNLIGFSAGLAVAGWRPFACSFAIFATGRGWEQIRNTVATSNLPVTIVGSHAGILTGEDGETHQSLEDFAVLRAIPNLKIFCPADGVETEKLVEHILQNETGPVYLRLSRADLPVIFDEKTKFDFAKIKFLPTKEIQNPKCRVAVFATGALLNSVLAAAEKLAEKKIAVSIFNVCQISPLDSAGVLRAAANCDFAVSAEDHSVCGGLGSAISEVFAENAVDKKLIRIGMRGFGESGTPQDLYEKYGFDAVGIFKKIADAAGD
jgi:transketolase